MGNLRSMIAQEAKAFCCIGPRRRADSKWRSQNKWIEIFRRRRIATRKLSHLLWRFSNHVCAAGVSTLQSIVHTWQMKVVHQHNLASSIRSWISATSGREIVVRIGRDGSCWETSAYVSVSTSSPSAHLFFFLFYWMLSYEMRSVTIARVKKSTIVGASGQFGIHSALARWCRRYRGVVCPFLSHSIISFTTVSIT